MPRDPRYDILFEPVKIGPVTAPNRFYQVPHCTGMGMHLPRTNAAMRAVKAEGGWGVVCTEYCSIHPSSDDSPYAFCTLWDDDDVRVMAAIAEAIHAGGALAGVELWHGGAHTDNRLSHLPLLAPGPAPGAISGPHQARAMDKADIRNVRAWHGDAVRRAIRAGFDIVYVYAGHGYLLHQFMLRRTNPRTDEYGGSLANRVRLTRELMEDARTIAGDRVAIALRFGVDELLGAEGLTSDGEARDIVGLLAELPDLWDVNVGDAGNDSMSSRFGDEGWQEPHVAWVKTLTTKPVVGVGRFTSPDAMAGQVRRGVLDLIGAARPSIADPFLPRKVAEGRIEDIRECIGCNICRSANNEGVPLRCTQNPTMGEEWRRGWHPERIAPKASGSSVLVVGAGPAGLEAARALGQRGYHVTLAEAADELGGRVARECRMPGFAAWGRVRDWRVGQIAKLTNVEVYRGSAMGAADVLAVGADHVVLATGARWRRDGVGRHTEHAPAIDPAMPVGTPDDILAGRRPDGRVVVIDDDPYYMGGAMAEVLRRAGRAVTLATPHAVVGPWSAMTNEQERIQARLVGLGVTVVPGRRLAAVEAGRVVLHGLHGEPAISVEADAVVLVTMRLPVDELYHALVADPASLERAGVRTVTRLGDGLAPGTIAMAVRAGHAYARELDDPLPAIRRERILV
ncbi:MAG: NADH:flavin oxidoreductase [Alphaproteobacteria bacterium]|nr:NADH:flavin oxidoreductase [Alphaproteobacteria bacterium]